MAKGAHIRVTASGIALLARQFRKAGQSVDALGRKGTRAGAALNQSFRGVTHQVRGFYATLGGAIGIGVASKAILDYRNALGQLQADALMSTQEIEALNQQVLTLASSMGAQRSQIVSALDVFQNYGGMLREGQKELKTLAKIHIATGTDMGELARIQAVMMKDMGLNAKEATQAMIQFNEQTVAGQVPLRDLAQVLPQVAAMGLGLKIKGFKAVEQLGTALQLAGGTTGGQAEQARTLVIALLRDVVKAEKKLKKMGIKIVDKPGQLRDLDAIIKEILKKTQNVLTGSRGFGRLFTQDSMQIVSAYSDAFDLAKNDYRADSKLKSVMEAGRAGDTTMLNLRYQTRTQGIAKEAKQVEHATATMDSMLQDFGGKAIRYVAENPTKALMMASGAYAGWKMLPAVGRALFAGKGKKGLGGLGGLAAAAGGVQKVFVVNLPGELGAAGGAGSSVAAVGAGGWRNALNSTKLAQKVNAFGDAAGWKGWLGGALAAGAAGYALGTALDQATGASDSLSDWLVARDRAASQKNLPAYEKKIAKQNTLQQAKDLAALAAKGLESFEVAPGKRVALTQENIMDLLFKRGAERGLGIDELQALMAEIKQLTDAVRQNPVAVQVKPAGGLDRLEVESRRGR